MDSDESIKSIINEIIDNTDNDSHGEMPPGRPTISIGDFATQLDAQSPGTSASIDSKNEDVKRSRSEPNNLHSFFTSDIPIEFHMEPPKSFLSMRQKVRRIEPETERTSKISLHVQSERMNITTRSTVRFSEDPVRIHAENVAPQSSNPGSGTNEEITVLYPENDSFASSESLIAKESMGQSLLTVQPRSTDGLHPPPYHIATAHDTASIQLTPAAAPPLVLYSAPPLQGAPPTYSALMHIGPTEVIPPHREVFSRRDVQIQPSAPFIAPPPPPSYAQAQGFVSHPMQYGGPIDPHDSLWNTEPVTTICPFCNNFVVTTVRYRRSNLTHYSALALCICGCWPCCLLPYCMKSCKCAHHECPICANTVGIYSPWQIS